MDYIVLIVLLSILLMITILAFIKIKEHFSYLDYSSKCFSCERQFIKSHGEGGAWLGNQTKLFSAERAGVNQKGNISGGFIGHGLRYY